jgi:hypothetical protein
MPTIRSRAELLSHSKSLLQTFFTKKLLSRDAFKELAKASVDLATTFPVDSDTVDRSLLDMMRQKIPEDALHRALDEHLQNSTPSGENTQISETVPSCQEPCVAALSNAPQPPEHTTHKPISAPLSLSSLKSHMQRAIEQLHCARQKNDSASEVNSADTKAQQDQFRAAEATAARILEERLKAEAAAQSAHPSSAGGGGSGTSEPNVITDSPRLKRHRVEDVPVCFSALPAQSQRTANHKDRQDLDALYDSIAPPQPREATIVAPPPLPVLQSAPGGPHHYPPALPPYPPVDFARPNYYPRYPMPPPMMPSSPDFYSY